MGLTTESLKILFFSRNLFKDKEILALGNPFFSKQRLIETSLDKKIISEIFTIDRNKRAEYMFKRVFNSQLTILDNSNEEEADWIYDLNEEIKDSSLKGKFDLIIDPGTSEHIFDLKSFYKNIFFLLKKGGIYFFQVPLNGWIDHGFRQYSPTFFYDLCFGNKESLSLIKLFAFHRDRKKLINILPFYKSREATYKFDKFQNDKSFGSLNLKKFTNTYFYLLSKNGGLIDNIGMIKKLKNKDLNFSISQQIYRISSLGDLLPDIEKKEFINNKKVNFFKKVFLFLPLTNSLKLKIIEIYCKYRSNF